LDRKLLDIICCPVTRSSLELLSERELTTLNELIGLRRIKNREDSVVDAPLAEALVTRSAKLIYPVRDGIPVLLEEQAMPLQQLEGS
jgi:uncharacterized protein YbaR (Trm112 family)